MNHTHHTTPATLEEIAQRKADALQRLRNQKEVMTEITRDIFTPLAPAADKAGSMMRAFNTGMAVFDGVKMGIKIMRRLRMLFGRDRKRF